MVYFFYYVPVGINVELRRVPVLTYAFAGLCLFIFFLNRYLPGLIPFDFERLAYYPDAGTLATAVSATFLHGGYLHLAGNLVYLLLLGRYVEDRLGALVFSTIFLGCGAVGALLQGAFNTLVLKSPDMGIIGASGAVSGLLGAFTVRFLSNKLRIAYWVFMPLQAFTRAGKTELPVIFAIIFWFALEFLRGLLQAGGYGLQVAYVAHVSGFLMGAAAALVAGEFEEGRMEAILQRGLDHLRRGELYAAQGDYIQYLEARPGDPDAHAGLARTLVVTRDTGGARVHYRTACELLLEAKRRGDCENVFQEALRGIEDFSLGPDHQLGLAFGLERNLKPELAVRAYELFAGRYPDHAESAFALLRAAGIHLHTFSDPRAAMSLYERLVRDYPDDAWADFAREQRRKLLCQIG